MEVPVAFQTAIANASMDSFSKNFPDFFKLVDEEIEGNCGKILGTQLCIDGVNVSVLALSNASIGGIGPNEDIEGNVNLYEKGKLMAELGLDSLPSYVIEGKVCAQPFSAEISEPTFLIRAFPDHDNPIIARSLEKAAQKLNYPAAYKADLLSRSDNAMRNLTQEQGEYIQELGRKISGSTTAVEKVRLAAELNRFASEDLGGITFMSEDVHRVMGGVGCIPGTSCVLSLFIPNPQLEEDVIPTLTIDDADRYVNLIIEGISFLRNLTEEALLHMNKVKSVFGI